MDKNKTIKDLLKNLIKPTLRWIMLSLIMGVIIGIIVGYFNIILKYANNYRKNHNYLIYFLPFAGIVIAYMYIKTKRNAYSGENLLKSEVQKAAKNIPVYMIGVVFIGSLLTTFFGGSAGKEGTGVVMGGTLGDYLSRKFKLNDSQQRSMVISGVGSAFGVLYNVPFAGAILGMELVIKGSFNYESLIPAFLTSVIANEVSLRIGNEPIKYIPMNLEKLNMITIFNLIILGILFGLVGLIFNFIMDNSSKVYNFFTKNPIIKGFLGGIITIILSLIVGENFNGLGQNFINKSFYEAIPFSCFLWKIIFTAVALGSVFQGGRGNPVFFVGATFGSSIAEILKIPIETAAGLGMIGVFCSAQSLPITSIAIAVEYFGTNQIIPIIIIMIISYIISGVYDILSKKEIDENKKNILKGETS